MTSTIGARVKASRVRAGLTQQELAQAAGCSQQTIVDIEARSSRSKFLPAIARVLRESVDYFETGAGSSVAASLLLPHFDLYALADEHPIPVDRIFGPVDPSEPCFTLAVDAATVQRSQGYLDTRDVVYCTAPRGTHSAWVVAWMFGWVKAEVCRLAVSEGSVYLCPPNGKKLELKTGVVVAKSRAEANVPAPVDGPAPCWIVAAVVGIFRPC